MLNALFNVNVMFLFIISVFIIPFPSISPYLSPLFLFLFRRFRLNLTGEDARALSQQARY